MRLTVCMHSQHPPGGPKSPSPLTVDHLAAATSLVLTAIAPRVVDPVDLSAVIIVWHAARVVPVLDISIVGMTPDAVEEWWRGCLVAQLDVVEHVRVQDLRKRKRRVSELNVGPWASMALLVLTRRRPSVSDVQPLQADGLALQWVVQRLAPPARQPGLLQRQAFRTQPHPRIPRIA